MKIAVASQNRRTITEHAGRCRKFWIYEIEQGEVSRKAILELPKEQSFHDSSPHEPHPLDDVQVLISRGMGQGLMHRLAARGIQGVITAETEPDQAVAAYLDGTLLPGSPCSQAHGHHQAHAHEEDDEA
jgi:predicted Fe-Mo cluster-binding NifX family protein